MAQGDNLALREQIATCTRLLVMQEIMDFSGHVSAHIPGTDRVLIQPRDTSRAGLTAEDILVVDMDCNVLEGEGPCPSETALHTSVYRARPDVTTVCHGHPTMSTLFTTVDRPFPAVRNFAYRFAGAQLPIHEDTTHIRTEQQGDSVAESLGGHSVCLLRAHGTVVASPSMEELFMDCLDLEEAARSALYASMLGNLLPLTDREVEELRASYGRNSYRAGKVWDHYVQKGRQAGII